MPPPSRNWIWIVMVGLIFLTALCAVATQWFLGVIPASWRNVVVVKWQIAQSEEPLPPQIVSDILSGDIFTEHFAAAPAPAPSAGEEDSSVHHALPIDIPVWKFGGSGVDSTYDSGVSPVKQSPNDEAGHGQPALPAGERVTPEPSKDCGCNPSGGYQSLPLTSGASQREALPELAQRAASGGAPRPTISTAVETGSNSRIKENHCTYVADSGSYVC
jgi:hypothetical protein